MKPAIRVAALCCMILFPSARLWARVNVDSLETVLSTRQLTPMETLHILSRLETAYINSDAGKTAEYCRMGIPIAIKENAPEYLGGYYCGLGTYYGGRLEYDTAFYYLNLAFETAQRIKNDPVMRDDMVSRIYGTMGNLNYYRGFYREALKYYLKAMAIFEKYDYQVSLFSVLTNIGSIYYDLENYEQTGMYYSKALKLAQKRNDSVSVAYALHGLSGVSVHNKDYDQALEYLEKASRIYRQAGMEVYCIDASLCLSELYAAGYKDYDQALKYALDALEIVKRREVIYETANTLSHAATAYYGKGMYRQSESTAFEALAADSSDEQINSVLYLIIAKSDIMLGDRAKALEYLDKYTAIVSETGTKNFQSSLSEMEVQYETEKKELRISALEKERELYRWLGFAGGAAALLLVALLVVRRRMVRQKIARLEQEKRLAATQAVLDGETAERTRLARDLHDGLGGMLSVVKLNINDMKQGAVLEHPDVGRFDKALKMLDDAIGELRRVAHNMMPDSLSRYGLKAALSDFCDGITSAEFHYFGSGERLDQKLEVMIYRTVHELVNNALKHAGALKIIVQIVQESGRVSVTVQDDGCGFDASAPVKGSGLQNIRSRMEAYRGHMEISSRPGEGTEINIEFRLPEDHTA